MTNRGGLFYAKHHSIKFVIASCTFRNRLRNCQQWKQRERQHKRSGCYITAANSDRDGQSRERERKHEHEEYEYEEYEYEKHEHGQHEYAQAETLDAKYLLRFFRPECVEE